MPKKIVDTILPTTMVGSYPRPHWYHAAAARARRAGRVQGGQHEEAYHDATRAVIRDQEEAGLDIVTDGQMSFDDYVGVIGSFCWYMYERTAASSRRARRIPPARDESERQEGHALLTTGAA